MSRTVAHSVKAIGLALAFMIALAVPATAKHTHFLALAACPTWKKIDGDPDTTRKMAQSCERDVNAIVPALSKALTVGQADTITKLNKDLDLSGLTNAFKTLSMRAEPEDRVVIYINLHGDKRHAIYRGQPVVDEVLALYSEKRPENPIAAIRSGSWITVKQLRDMIDTIQAEEIILIVEACQSAAGMKDLKYDLIKRYSNGWKGREAVIFSSRDLEDAAYNEDNTLGLFTETFSKAMSGATGGNLRDTFDKARIKTHRSRRATCLKKDNLQTYFEQPSTYLEVCTQMPEAYDPYGLLDDIAIGGKSMDSRWHEIVAEWSRQDNKQADPFAWAKSKDGKIRFTLPEIRATSQ